MRIVGHVDRIDEYRIDGWIADLDAPDNKIALEILLDDRIVAWCKADQFRQDLDDAGQGIGMSAFYCTTPDFIAKADIARLALRLEGSVVFLRPGPAQDLSRRSSGLWIDRADWIDRLGRRQRDGEMSEALALSIVRFVRDGYVVLQGAVAEAEVDAVNAEIERAWAAPPRGLLVEVVEADGSRRTARPTPALRQSRGGMLDLFAHSEVVAKAVAAPLVVSFLGAVFGEMPKAFQSRSLWHGAQPPLRNGAANEMIGCLALEDMDPAASGPGLQARKGDVLVWPAGLAQGGGAQGGAAEGSVAAQPGGRSLVTHFTAAASEPFYRRHASFKERDMFGCRFVSQYGDVGDAALVRG